MQNIIKTKTNLLDGSGSVAEPGRSHSGLYVYNRDAVTAHPLRLKEWDFYQISDERYTIQITFADVGFGSTASFVCFDRLTGQRFEKTKLKLLTMGKNSPGRDDNTARVHRASGREYSMLLTVGEKERRFTLSSLKLEADITISVPDGNEFLMMAVPFRQRGKFYLNKKMNCMPAKGYVRAGGRTIGLSENAFCVLDWGRGVWPFHEKWYWGNGSTRLADGRLFGFELGCGFGVMESFTENTLFIENRAQAIGNVEITVDGYDKPWRFTEENGRLNAVMIPEYDNFSMNGIPYVIGNKCHQVWGRWFGEAVLESGETVDLGGMTAFCEFSDNRW